MSARRSQAERTEATRTALIAAARPLFAAHGYAAVATEELVRAAGVTRGALYHHFDGKEGLFAAVFEAVERDLSERLGALIADGAGGAAVRGRLEGEAASGGGVVRGVPEGEPASGGDAAQGALAGLFAAVDAWLDLCREPEVQRIALLDGPVVLGWERWREIGFGYGMGLMEAGLAGAMEAGALARQPVRPLAHVLLGAVEEAGLVVGRAADPAAARDQMSAALRSLLAGLAAR